MCTIYKEGINPNGKKFRRKVKSFGDFSQANTYGWKLSNENSTFKYFMITNDGRCLKFNKQIII